MSTAVAICDNLKQRLRNVQVGIREELAISRHIFRGRPSYVVQDPVTFQAHQLSVEDYQVYIALDSQRPLAMVFEELVERGVLAREREEAFYRFVVHLHQFGLLNLPLSSGKTLYARFAKKQVARSKSRVLGWLFLRVPLCRPDAFLTRTVRFVAPLFTRSALAVWAVLVLAGVCVVAARWDSFRSPLGTMLALNNLPVLWCLLIGLKVVHELGHAYACKHFGGCVPEMGAFLVLFTPCAYVDASAAWGFTRRTERIIVSLAGMYFESIVAMIAVAVWCLTGPSAIHSLAQYAVVLSTAVTIAFNINPLMQYDGYYLLSDLVNVPNLRALSTAQLLSSAKRLVLRVPTAPVASTAMGRLGLVAFGIATSCYRISVLLAVTLIIALKIPAAGLGIAVTYLGTSGWRLGSRLLRYILYSEEVAHVRRRALAITAVLVLLGLAGFLLLPTPGSVQTVGTLGQQGECIVRASGSGFLGTVEIDVGDAVREGRILCALENAELATARQRKEADVEQLRVQLHDQVGKDPLAAAATQQRLAQAMREEARLATLCTALTIKSPLDGRVTKIPGLEDAGRYVRKGEILATISRGPWVVNALASETAMASCLPSLGDFAEIRLLGHGGRTFTGKVIQVAQSGSRKIDDAPLTHLGGGSIAVSSERMEADQPFFKLQIAIDQPDPRIVRHGMTALASFPGHRTVLGHYLYRRVLSLLDHLRVLS